MLNLFTMKVATLSMQPKNIMVSLSRACFGKISFLLPKNIFVLMHIGYTKNTFLQQLCFFFKPVASQNEPPMQQIPVIDISVFCLCIPPTQKLFQKGFLHVFVFGSIKRSQGFKNHHFNSRRARYGQMGLHIWTYGGFLKR